LREEVKQWVEEGKKLKKLIADMSALQKAILIARKQNR